MTTVYRVNFEQDYYGSIPDFIGLFSTLDKAQAYSQSLTDYWRDKQNEPRKQIEWREVYDGAWQGMTGEYSYFDIDAIEVDPVFEVES